MVRNEIIFGMDFDLFSVFDEKVWRRAIQDIMVIVVGQQYTFGFFEFEE